MCHAEHKHKSEGLNLVVSTLHSEHRRLLYATYLTLNSVRWIVEYYNNRNNQTWPQWEYPVYFSFCNSLLHVYLSLSVPSVSLKRPNSLKSIFWLSRCYFSTLGALKSAEWLKIAMTYIKMICGCHQIYSLQRAAVWLDKWCDVFAQGSMRLVKYWHAWWWCECIASLNEHACLLSSFCGNDRKML